MFVACSFSVISVHEASFHFPLSLEFIQYCFSVPNSCDSKSKRDTQWVPAAKHQQDTKRGLLHANLTFFCVIQDDLRHDATQECSEDRTKG